MKGTPSTCTYAKDTCVITQHKRDWCQSNVLLYMYIQPRGTCSYTIQLKINIACICISLCRSISGKIYIYECTRRRKIAVYTVVNRISTTTLTVLSVAGRRNAFRPRQTSIYDTTARYTQVKEKWWCAQLCTGRRNSGNRGRGAA